jgi:hypothetical protein
MNEGQVAKLQKHTVEYLQNTATTSLSCDHAARSSFMGKGFSMLLSAARPMTSSGCGCEALLVAALWPISGRICIHMDATKDRAGDKDPVVHRPDLKCCGTVQKHHNS